MGMHSPTEAIWVEILDPKDFLKLKLYYPLPDQNFETDLEIKKEIREMSQVDNVILGNINYLHSDWVNMWLSCATETSYEWLCPGAVSHRVN